jgi:hypothetical protein
MRIRPSLLPPPLDPSRVAQLTALADQIIERMNQGHHPADLIAVFNKEVGGEYRVGDFHGVFESIGSQAFVEQVLRPTPTRVTDITDAELLEVISFLAEARGSVSEQGYWLTFLERNLPYPAIADLIYYRDLTPEGILSQAKAYRPIIL